MLDRCRRNKKEPAKPKEPKAEMISLFKVMKYSDTKDKLMALIGVLFSILAGLVTPSIALVMGELIAIYDPRSTPEEINEGIEYLVKIISIIAITLWIFSYLQYSFMQHSAEKLAFSLRTRYLTALMR